MLSKCWSRIVLNFKARNNNPELPPNVDGHIHTKMNAGGWNNSIVGEFPSCTRLIWIRSSALLGVTKESRGGKGRGKKDNEKKIDKFPEEYMHFSFLELMIYKERK